MPSDSRYQQDMATTSSTNHHPKSRKPSASVKASSNVGGGAGAVLMPPLLKNQTVNNVSQEQLSTVLVAGVDRSNGNIKKNKLPPRPTNNNSAINNQSTLTNSKQGGKLIAPGSHSSTSISAFAGAAPGIVASVNAAT